MAFTRRINRRASTADDTGFGANSNYGAGRFFNRDGTPNVVKRGVSRLERYSLFHSLLAMPRWKFLCMILLFFIVVNLFFAGVYFLIGVDHLGGMVTNSELEKFGEAFFFSAQTFTTVGYGRINPTGFLASFVASLEALIGLLSFAVATGLLYGRFSRPVAFIRYGEKALISPFKDGIALMFRLVPYKNNHLTEVEVKVTLAMRVVDETGRKTNKFYPLKLEIEKVNALALSWTIVHPIDESSPMFGITADDLIQTEAEILIFLRGFDESFSNTVVSRSSYTADEIVFGAKFSVMMQPGSNGETTVLHIDRLSHFEPADLPNLKLIRNTEEPGS